MIKSKMMRLAEHVSRMEERINSGGKARRKKTNKKT
jgi:hypothetical protein